MKDGLTEGNGMRHRQMNDAAEMNHPPPTPELQKKKEKKNLPSHKPNNT